MLGEVSREEDQVLSIDWLVTYAMAWNGLGLLAMQVTNKMLRRWLTD